MVFAVNLERMDDAFSITSTYNVQSYRKLDRIIGTIVRDAFLIN